MIKQILTLATLGIIFSVFTTGSLNGKTVGEKVDEGIEKTKDTYHDAKDKVKDTYHDAKDKVKDTYHDAKDKASDTYHDAKDKLREKLKD